MIIKLRQLDNWTIRQLMGVYILTTVVKTQVSSFVHHQKSGGKSTLVSSYKCSNFIILSSALIWDGGRLIQLENKGFIGAQCYVCTKRQ